MATEAAEQLASLAMTMAQALVDDPKDVCVTHTVGNHVVVLELGVRPGEVGKVIGRQGVYANAMRILLSAAAGRLRKTVQLEVVVSHLHSHSSR